MDIANIDLNNISLDDSFDEEIILFLSEFWLGILNLKKANNLKNNEIKNQCRLCGILKDRGIGVCQKMRKNK